MTTTTNWEKEFEYKFGSCAILGSIGRLYSGGFANEARVAEAIDFIRHLLAEQRSELLDLVGKEVIGEDENFLLQMAELKIVIDHDHWDYAKKFLKNTIETRNGLRYKQRQKLSALRLEGGKK